MFTPYLLLLRTRQLRKWNVSGESKLLMIAALLSLVTVTNCGGGSAKGMGGGSGGTPLGTFAVTVAATGSTLMHTADVTLVVQ